MVNARIDGCIVVGKEPICDRLRTPRTFGTSRLPVEVPAFAVFGMSLQDEEDELEDDDELDDFDDDEFDDDEFDDEFDEFDEDEEDEEEEEEDEFAYDDEGF